MARIDAETTLGDIKALMRKFVDDRDWRQYHSAKNLAMAIATEAAELMEPLRWADADGERGLLSEPEGRQALADELADILLLVAEFADVFDIDLASAAIDKMGRNEQRYPVEKSRGNASKYTKL